MARSSRSSSPRRPDRGLLAPIAAVGIALSLLVGRPAAAAPAAALASPELRSVLPTGAQRGTTVRLTLSGERLGGAQELLFYAPGEPAGPGISVTSLANTDERTVVADCAISPDCPLGEHPLRLRTASGITELATIYVGSLPVVAEVEPNGDLASAQSVLLDTTVAGLITREDTDWFAISAKAGERIAVEIEGMRLGRGMFDPAIAILDDRRFELAVSDDSFLVRQDSTASVLAPSDGTYYVVVREASYGGSDISHYRLHIGTFPRPQMASPLAVKPGEPTAIAWIGDPKLVPPTTVTLPAQASSIQPVWARDGEALAPSPNWVVASSIPVVEELPADAPPPTAGSETMPPIAFHGVLSKPGEEDRFKVRVKAGEPLVLRVLSRRLRSPLDAVVSAYDGNGNMIGSLDDTAGADPELAATPGEDAVFELRIRDHRHRGGEAYAYRLELAKPQPSLGVALERVDNRRPQFLQSIAVPRGGRFAAMLRAERQDAPGEVQVQAPRLPVGVSLRTQPIPADLPAVPIVFEAAADAPPNGGLYELLATAGSVAGGFRQTMPLVIGPPNETVYYETTVDRIAIAATEAAPFRVTLVPPSAPILRQGGKQLKVVVERDPGFTADVVVQMLWNPPGLSSANSITVPAAQGEGAYQLNASGDAPAKTWKVAVLAHAAVQGGDVWISSDLIDLTVAEPFEAGTLQLAATEQGKPASVLCKLQSVRAFDGKAKLTLFGLPPKTSCQPKEFSSSDQELVFEVATEADAPVGQHRGLFCELERVEAGEVITHRLAFDGVLRIDAPPPSEAAAPPAPAPPPPAPVAPPRPLSRLEQLRKQAAGDAAKRNPAEKPQ